MLSVTKIDITLKNPKKKSGLAHNFRVEYG
jgi:hypothetical protein